MAETVQEIRERKVVHSETEEEQLLSGLTALLNTIIPHAMGLTGKSRIETIAELKRALSDMRGIALLSHLEKYHGIGPGIKKAPLNS